jgi:hypothetical protein
MVETPEPLASTTVRAEGAGAIAVGGDAINSIFVTGGVNQFFIGRYERLADAYLSPRALYRELKLDQFTGRTWLLAAINDFIASNDRGYILLEAEAGLGKTAFMAWLARERGYVHHFVRLMPDADDIGVALRSLSAQLIRAWDLKGLAVGGVLPANASRPDFFEEVLFEASEARDAVRPGEPIVVVVDGLNETRPAPGQNPLALPADLPNGVFIVASQRTVHVLLSVLTPQRVLRIRADSAENLSDMRSYLADAVTRPDLADRLAAAGAEPEILVERLLTRSAGVWLVLRYVLSELRSGSRTADDLASLPVGLWHYYAQYWRQWQQTNEAKWSTVDLPLLVTLTAVQEPVTFDLLCELSGCPEPDRAATLVSDSWRPFLQVHEEPQWEDRYAAFHDSLREFVAGRVQANLLTSAERAFVGRLSAAHRTAHQRIADRYLTAWGGLPEGLPGLRGDATNMDGGYGMRQLVHHLVQASADRVLHGLMALEWPGDEVVDAVISAPATNAWYEAHRTRRAFASYAFDVERAWARAEQWTARPTMAHEQRSIALELRYAVIAASVNSVAGNVPADLLLLLIDDGQASTAQALELALEITDARRRAEAITALVPRLTGESRQKALRAALASVQLIPDGYWRAGELLRLLPLAASEYAEDLAQVACGITRDRYRITAAKAVLAHVEQSAQLGLPASLLDDASVSSIDSPEPEAFALQYHERTRQAVMTLLLGAGAVLNNETDAPNRVGASRLVTDARWRAELLTASAHNAPAEVRGPLLRGALNVALTVGDRDALGSALGSIAACLAELGEVDAALASLAMLRDSEGRARALFAVATHTSTPERADVVHRALEATAKITNILTRGEVLRQHGAHLASVAEDPRLDQVLAPLGHSQQVSVLATMAEHVDIDRREAMITTAFDIACSISEPYARARATTELIPYLADTHLSSARDVIDAIDDAEQRDRATAVLAGRFARLGEAEAAEQLMQTIADRFWLMEAQFSTANGLAASGQSEHAGLVAARLSSPPSQAEALALVGRWELAFDLADTAPDPSTRIAILLRIGTVAASIASPPGPRDAIEEARKAVAAVRDVDERLPWVIEVGQTLARTGRTSAALDLVRALPHVPAAALLRLASHVGSDDIADALALAHEVSDPRLRARVLASLTSSLVAVGAPGLLDHVREVLHLLAAGTRAQLVAAIPDLMPGLVQLAGAQAPVDMAAAVTAAYRWWP